MSIDVGDCSLNCFPAAGVEQKQGLLTGLHRKNQINPTDLTLACSDENKKSSSSSTPHIYLRVIAVYLIFKDKL